MALVVLLLLSASSCSIKRMAVGMIGNALAEGGETYGSDDDPDLVGQAVPFGLKLMESLLAQVPEHRGLLTAAAKGFTQYAYAYVQFEADQVESRDLARATELRRRARNLYLRARDYGLRGLETRHRGFGEALRAAPAEAVQTATRDDLALLYWTGAAWGAAIGVSKEPDLVADQLIVEALFDRVLALEETFDHGAVHGVLIGYEFARQGAAGDPEDRSRRHFERAVELTGGQSSGPYVSFAETAAVRRQDRAEFERLLHLALAVDPDARPAWRLANLIMQRRARWLLARGDELFADPPELEGSGSAFRLDPR
jgi:predicted anti-sigma-YlaC factor YlaD